MLELLSALHAALPLARQLREFLLRPRQRLLSQRQRTITIVEIANHLLQFPALGLQLSQPGKFLLALPLQCRHRRGWLVLSSDTEPLLITLVQGLFEGEIAAGNHYSQHAHKPLLEPSVQLFAFRERDDALVYPE